MDMKFDDTIAKPPHSAETRAESMSRETWDFMSKERQATDRKESKAEERAKEHSVKRTDDVLNEKSRVIDFDAKSSKGSEQPKNSTDSKAHPTHGEDRAHPSKGVDRSEPSSRDHGNTHPEYKMPNAAEAAAKESKKAASCGKGTEVPPLHIDDFKR